MEGHESWNAGQDLSRPFFLIHHAAKGRQGPTSVIYAGKRSARGTEKTLCYILTRTGENKYIDEQPALTGS